MATALRILCVHGVGQHPPGGAWQQAWEAAIHEACRQVDAERALDIQYCHYDDIFAQHKVGLGDTLEALARLLANGHELRIEHNWITSNYPDYCFTSLGPDPVLPDPADTVVMVELKEE